MRSKRILATARPTVPKPTRATLSAGVRSREMGWGLASNACSGGVLCNACSQEWKLIFIIRGTRGSAKWKASKAAGGMPGRVGIKVGNIMRSRRNQGQMPACEESQAEPLLTAPLASSCRALRSATRPVMGGEWMIGKFAATASVLALLVLTILLGAQGFAQTTPAGQTPATPAPRRNNLPRQLPLRRQPDSSQEPADEGSYRGGNAFTTTRTGTSTWAPAPTLTAARRAPG